MLSLIKGIGNALGLRQRRRSVAASSSTPVSSRKAENQPPPPPDFDQASTVACGDDTAAKRQQKAALKTRGPTQTSTTEASDQAFDESPSPLLRDHQQAATQQQIKSVRFSGQLEADSGPAAPTTVRVDGEATLASPTAVDASTPEHYDNWQKAPIESSSVAPPKDLLLTVGPVYTSSSAVASPCKLTSPGNEESLNPTDFSEQISSELYPSLELRSERGLLHVTSNFDRLPYQGTHWILQQQQIDEKQRLIDMQLMQDEQRAEEERLYLEEQNGEGESEAARPIPVESGQVEDEVYDNETGLLEVQPMLRGEEDAAALVIQRVMKGHLVRSRRNSQKRAAVTIQAHLRGFLTRRRAHRKKKENQNLQLTVAPSFESSLLNECHLERLQRDACSDRVLQSSGSEYDLCSCCCGISDSGNLGGSCEATYFNFSDTGAAYDEDEEGPRLANLHVQCTGQRPTTHDASCQLEKPPTATATVEEAETAPELEEPAADSTGADCETERSAQANDITEEPARVIENAIDGPSVDQIENVGNKDDGDLNN